MALASGTISCEIDGGWEIMLEQFGSASTIAAVAAMGIALGGAMPAHAQKKEGVVVMPLKSKSVKGDALNAINELLIFSVTQLSPYKVVTMTDIERRLYVLTRERFSPSILRAIDLWYEVPPPMRNYPLGKFYVSK